MNPAGVLKLYVNIINTIIISNQIVIDIGTDSVPNILFIVIKRTKHVIRTQNLKDTFC